MTVLAKNTPTKSLLAAISRRSSSARAAILSAIVGLVLAALARWRRARPRGCCIIPGHWLLGGLPAFAKAAMKNQHNEWFQSLHQMFGQSFALWAPGVPWKIMTMCPKNIEYILKGNFQNYPKGKNFQATLFELLGGGIFNADGHEWMTQRKVSSHMFTANLFKEHIWVVVQRNARKLRDILQASSADETVDVFNLMNRFTLDTIGEIGFGKSIGSMEDPSSPFLKSFDRSQEISFWRVSNINPFWRIMRLLGVGTERGSKEHFGLLDSYSREVVRELCDAINSGKESNGFEARKSFLGLFLEDAKKRGEHLSEDYLRDLVLNFLIAGRDTTAQALSWTIFHLAQHKDITAKVRQEVADVCGIRGPSYDDMPRLTYLNAVLNEGLRLFPSVPIGLKSALSDDTLPDGTFVPRGTDVAYNIYSRCRDPATWGDDADKFRPERWLEMQRPPTPYEYPVFNAGPRECLGKRLAVIEMKTCLAMVLPYVSFELAKRPEEITPSTQLTIGMGKGGLPCYVTAASKDEKSSARTNISTTMKSDTQDSLSDADSSTGVSENAK